MVGETTIIATTEREINLTEAYTHGTDNFITYKQNTGQTLFICFIIIIFNVVFLLSLRNAKGVQKSRKIKVLLSNIAIAHIIFSTAAITSVISYDSKRECLFKMMVAACASQTAITSTMIMALEVNMVSRRTRVGQTGMSPLMLYILLGASWVFWICIHLVGVLDTSNINTPISCVYGNQYYKPVHIIFVLVLILLHFPVIISLHVATVFQMKRNIREMEGRRNIAEATPSDYIILNRLRSYRAFLGMILLQCLLFVVAWGPLFAFMIYIYMTEGSINDPNKVKVPGSFIFINSVAHFFANLIYSKDFRKAVMRTFCPCLRQNIIHSSR